MTASATPATDVAPGEFAENLDAYRDALRSYLATADLDDWRGRHFGSTEERIGHHAKLMGVLSAAGWSRYGWPTFVGGLGGDERHRAVLYDLLSEAGLPVPDPHLVLETLAAPTIRFNPELAAETLPAFLRGEQWWGQGFSEPEAGSDLASLRCRARREGDNYIVSGQKLWTSHGATASRLVCLVRTGTPESRHRGLSMIMIDADAPGVSVRPLALASGFNEVAELFFDDVVVPANRLLGEEGQGWAVAMYLLQFERAQYAWLMSGIALHGLRSLIDELAARKAAGAALPDGTARRIGDLYSDVIALRARSAATVRRLAGGETVGPEASVDKVLLGGVEIAVHDLARDVYGEEFLFGADGPMATWRADWWYSRSATILGGSAEVQRSIIADHVLHLPKERDQ